MALLYNQLHELFNSIRRFHFPFEGEIEQIPMNGVYLIFEAGEKCWDWDRIVRVGTHTGNNQLRSRLYQHFLMQNKNRSIFRKNIGRCLLNKDNNPYLEKWDLDTTSSADKLKNGHLIDRDVENKYEILISNYIQENLSFSVFKVDSKEERIIWESRIISTLAAFQNVCPSKDWLGHSSPKEKIKKHGLWQVNELGNQQLNLNEFNKLKEVVLAGHH